MTETSCWECRHLSSHRYCELGRKEDAINACEARCKRYKPPDPPDYSKVPPEQGKIFGRTLIGAWLCMQCGYEVYPNELRHLDKEGRVQWVEVTQGSFVPRCCQHKEPMWYDEAE